MRNFKSRCKAILSDGCFWGTVTFLLAIVLGVLGGHRVRSESAQLQAVNHYAAVEFVTAVEEKWFYDRGAVTAALKKMEEAYLVTGEENPANLAQLRRLSDWLKNANTVADQQQLLTEVRAHGKVVTRDPFWFSTYDYCGARVGAFAGFLTWLIVALGWHNMVGLREKLKKKFAAQTV